MENKEKYLEATMESNQQNHGDERRSLEGMIWWVV
jgi:hypothetical protein